MNPRLMCRQHLMGEHVEMHMFIGALRAGTSVAGYVNTGLVEVHHIIKRHDRIAKEMVRRGYRHLSPLKYAKLFKAGKVSPEENLKELARRCKACRKQQY